MIGIYLRPNETQVVKAVGRKKALKVVAAKTLPAFYTCLLDRDVEGLTELFRQVDEAVGTAYEDIYLTLPDTLFVMDCAEAGQEDDEKRWFEAHTGYRYETFYSAYPVEFRARIHRMKSVAAIEKVLVDCLIEAAKAADVTLLSVEAAGISFLRTLGRWKEEVVLLEVFQDGANFVSYSPVAGLFSLPAPRLSADQWIPEAVSDAVLENDTVAKRTFRLMNLNVPIYVLSSEKLQLPDKLQERQKEQVQLPEGVLVSAEIFGLYQIPIGTILQGADGEAARLLPAYLKIQSANVLPQDVRLENRVRQVQKKVKKAAKWAVVSLSAVLMMELAGILYFGSFVIPNDLQQDYDRASQSMPQIKKELEIIKQAGNEHQFPVEALRILTNQKPADILYAGVEIGKQGKDWIHLDVKAKEAIQIRDYQAVLSDTPAFKDIRISQITTDEKTKMKNALLAIGKGKL